MGTQEAIDYQRIAEAITYLKQNFKAQPNLDEVAEKVNVSPYHFQRMFTDWAGISPKKFLQYLSIEHARQMLKENRATLADAAYHTGLSGTGRLHDLFMNIEGMTPAEYKNGGQSLQINYSFADTPFGEVLIASTDKGVCYMAFVDDRQQAFKELQEQFSNANYREASDDIQQDALSIFTEDIKPDQIKLHLKGTPFQIKVWEALLRIPSGGLADYGSIAQSIQTPKASRAVGSAIGSNPVCFLIPCHRVIRATGEFGQYHWGPERKTAMIGWEAAKVNG
ncbi:bifunctional helix-turn-helix domain-containing protein/methylated-DNA--[protein]-cysteine S-methyltransferase [Mucilaginibacter myungsuensis]|uniref:Methylated-DNA--[protein]-cysteine S-methyltransferase n=1 Tax=Mucilaginibacter myungsuensis TaxID=649104 RepID=A0A929KXW8_9SPHI|nr:methylated-DNA--[protein]-cysteine S-methyltransferase [Mucilaginibacter myungsuensis]MBE9662545.1 methylated-DNA--[protein]-cysteine S-methyltransferase [Mucilaginibacter myungsuensis]MDN3597964.1 methylated-DNA--[protein]-cysteine S-methyltransferase [Mucilaginibacter myungsuensis]